MGVIYTFVIYILTLASPLCFQWRCVSNKDTLLASKPTARRLVFKINREHIPELDLFCAVHDELVVEHSSRNIPRRNLSDRDHHAVIPICSPRIQFRSMHVSILHKHIVCFAAKDRHVHCFVGFLWWRHSTHTVGTLATECVQRVVVQVRRTYSLVTLAQSYFCQKQDSLRSDLRGEAVRSRLGHGISEIHLHSTSRETSVSVPSNQTRKLQAIACPTHTPLPNR